MQGLHRRVIIALAMAWTATAAAQFEPRPLLEKGFAPAEGRHLFNRSHEPALPSAYLKPVEFHVPGAKFVKLRFNQFNIPAGITVEISNPAATETWRYSKTERDAFTINPELGDDGVEMFSAMSVSGDTAIVRFTGFTSRFDPAYHSVEIAPSNVNTEPTNLKTAKTKGDRAPSIETSCGESERYDAVCWVDDHPDEYERSTPVALIITATGKQCSAWRVGWQNRLFTARHCIGGQSALDGAEIWFNYESTVCGGEENAQVVKVTGDELLASDYYLDYTLFSVNDFEKIKSFGNLGLDLRDGELGEGIFIPQHGNGNPKQIAIESDMNTSGLCEIDDNAVDSFIEASDIGYLCDTASSSSGSPVVSALTGKAIALHHNGGCMNSGTKVARIWPQVAEFFDGVVPQGDSDGNWAKANQPPVAQIEKSCTGLECRFDATNSEDPDGAIQNYVWSLGDGNTSEGPVVEHQFTQGGDYEIELTTLDDEGATDTVVQLVSVRQPNESPLAKFSTQCVENVCKFNAGGSSDNDGSIVSWKWTLGDGQQASGSVVEHTYKQAGDYIVDLTVEDDDQATDHSSYTVSVTTPNQAPTARFKIDCDYLECSANAAGSSDPDGDVAEYHWQFGDGSEASGQSAAVVYKEAGTYSVKLTVVDNEGETGSSEQRVSVDTKNSPPTAAFTRTCDLNVCSFDAGSSSDSDGQISSYQWSLGSRVRDTGKTVTYTYDDEGPHTVRLMVTDDRGAEAIIEKTFDITMPKEPVAQFSVSCNDLQCTLDAGSSIASSGTISRYDWSLGDGTTASGGNVTHEYQTEGQYTVTLKITDSSKAATTSQTIEVEARAKLQLETQLQKKPKRSTVSLSWNGSKSSPMEIYRNNQRLTSVSGITSYTDRTMHKLAGTVSYRVCETDTGRCSDIRKLRLGK